jgi:hypothetical protein
MILLGELQRGNEHEESQEWYGYGRATTTHGKEGSGVRVLRQTTL